MLKKINKSDKGKVQAEPCVWFRDNVHASVNTLISQAWNWWDEHVWLKAYTAHKTTPTNHDGSANFLKTDYIREAILHLSFLSNSDKQQFLSGCISS